MSKTRKFKPNRFDDDYDDEKNTRKGEDRRRERKMKAALRQRNFDRFMEEED